MKNKTARLLFTLLMAGSLFLSACSNQAKATSAPDAPAVDANQIYTQAAKTIEAGFALTQASLPTSTQTATQAPTATLEPTLALPTQVLATETPVVQATMTNTPPPPTATHVVLIPTNTPLVDKIEFVSISPARGTKIKKNASWDVNVVVKNAGGITWKQNSYSLRYTSGEKMGSPDSFLIQRDVKPGESYTFAFTMTAPDSTGNKQVYWAIVDSDGREIMWVDFNVEVVD